MLLYSYECYNIIYKGPMLSWNDFYASSGVNAWKVRTGKVDKYKKIFRHLLQEAKLPWFEEYAIVLFYNSRHDSDNACAGIKCLLDSFKTVEKKGVVLQKGYCHDDDKRYCKMTTAIYDKSLDHNEFKFSIIKIK